MLLTVDSCRLVAALLNWYCVINCALHYCISPVHKSWHHLAFSCLSFLSSQPRKELTTGRKQKNMATVSRQSAFWAVVALGLNTFTQDGGKVLGFPAEYSRALRLSPIVCIVDTLGVLFSVAFFCYKTRSIKHGVALAARYRGLTEEERAEPRLEQTWWFRLSIFALGALPQAVKILGMDGIPVTKIWGMAYLVSFLVLEGLDLLQPQQHRDEHNLETDFAVWNRGLRISGYVAVLTQHVVLSSRTVLVFPKLEFKYDPERGIWPPDPSGVTLAFIISGLLAAYPLYALTFITIAHLSVNNLAIRTSSPGFFVEDSQMYFWLMTCTRPFVLFCAFSPGCGSSPVIVGMTATSLLLTSVVFIFLLRDTAYEDQLSQEDTIEVSLRWLRELFGLRRSKRGKLGFPLLFAILSIMSIIHYYVGEYNPSNTYKPPWTEYLG